jgi:hypothetical protein
VGSDAWTGSSCNGAEASLSHVNDVQARLAESQREIEEEIAVLHAQLKESQDPTRMHLIQEMLSVRVLTLVGTFR